MSVYRRSTGNQRIETETGTWLWWIRGATTGLYRRGKSLLLNIFTDKVLLWNCQSRAGADITDFVLITKLAGVWTYFLNISLTNIEHRNLDLESYISHDTVCNIYINKMFTVILWWWIHNKCIVGVYFPTCYDTLWIGKLRRFYWLVKFCPLVELHQEGSAINVTTWSSFLTFPFILDSWEVRHEVQGGEAKN